MVLSLFSSLIFSFFSSLLLFHFSHAQQPFLNNKQLDCYNNASVSWGYDCNGVNRSCSSFLTFRSQPPYDTAVQISYLLKSNASEIAQINGFGEFDTIPTDTVVIVPVNCSCSGNFYQHNASYKLNSEIYLHVANDTYQGLTTCQSIMNQNEYDSRNLTPGLQLLVPLRCACPTRNQTANGIKFLLTYLIKRGDDYFRISKMFRVEEQSILDANELLVTDTIFYFNPLLIPLRSEPTRDQTIIPPPQAETPRAETVPASGNRHKRKWFFVGIGVGVGFILLAFCAFLVWLFYRRRRISQSIPEGRTVKSFGKGSSPKVKSDSAFSGGALEVVDSLMVYQFEELQKATAFFTEDCRISGSVYHGVINGDSAAIKRMKGDVTNEINILKQINHSNVIRLSGFCLHEGNSYLVYEFADNGSLSDLLHKKYERFSSLSWKQRVQIAHDVANGLNYLHSYASPPYIHKNLKSSNILLDGNFRGKVANFGLARTVCNQEDGLQLTRHVVGTQGYMAPEYLEHGLITPKLDVFAFGVVILELLSGREAAVASANKERDGDSLLAASIKPILEGENVRGKLKEFIDPCLRNDYPLDLAFALAQLAVNCIAPNPSSRPTMMEIFTSLSKILSSSLDWDSPDTTRSYSSVRGE